MKFYEYVLSVKDQFSPAFKRLESAAGVSQGKVESVAKSMQGAAQQGSVLNSVMSDIGRTVGTILTVGGVTSLASKIFGSGAEMEQTRIAFEVLLGGADKAKQKLAELQQFADKSPFNTKETFEAGQSLLAFGVKSKELVPIMNQIGDVSIGNSNKFKSLIDNYGKLVSAQKANTVDLNQFAIAGVPVWSELSKVVGKTGKDLRKHVEENGVSVGTINKILDNLTKEGGMFFGMMERQSQSTIVLWSTFTSHLETKGVEIFNRMQPAINSVIIFGDKLISNIEVATNFIGKNIDNIKLLAVAVTAGVVAWKAYVLWQQASMWTMTANKLVTAGFIPIMMLQSTTIGGLTTAQKLYALVTGQATMAQLGLNAAFLLNPITGVIAAFVLLAATLYKVWQNYQQLQEIRAKAEKQGKVDAYMQEKRAIDEISNSLEKRLKLSREDAQLRASELERNAIKNRLQVLREAESGRMPDVFLKENGLLGASKNNILKEIGQQKSRLQAAEDSYNKAYITKNPKAPGLDDKTFDGKDSISAGGKSAINITIHKVQYAEKVEARYENGSQTDAKDTEERMKEVLSRVINGGIYTANQ